MSEEKLDKTTINELIRNYDCKYCLGGDTCILNDTYRCNIRKLNEKCPHYIEAETKRI